MHYLCVLHFGEDRRSVRHVHNVAVRGGSAELGVADQQLHVLHVVLVGHLRHLCTRAAVWGRKARLQPPRCGLTLMVSVSMPVAAS
jgi:hypothetical protein